MYVMIMTIVNVAVRMLRSALPEPSRKEKYSYTMKEAASTCTLLVQFDGSYKPRRKTGGAGVAAFLVAEERMSLLEWQAIAIAQRHCDNVYAETVGCHYATQLAAKWHADLSSTNSLRAIMQGDILPVKQFLNYNARLRYPGIQELLPSIECTATQQLPCHTFSLLGKERLLSYAWRVWFKHA